MPRCAVARSVLERAPTCGEQTQMSASNRILDDMARLMTDAVGAAQGVRREVETVMRTQAQRILSEMDVVTREEFEAVREMAIMAREENERLAARLEALEAAMAAKG